MFTVADIREIAVQIEKNGEAAYRAAAQLISDSAVSEIFTWMAEEEQVSVFISAKKKTNIDTLRQVMYDEVKKIHSIRYPYNDYLYDIPDIQE